jgi:hypothetical protein
MHHNSMSNGKGPAAPYNPNGPNQSRPVGQNQNQSRPSGPYHQKPAYKGRPAPQHRPPMNAITIKQDLFKAFQEKIAAVGKSPAEAVNQLVALYVEGKIVLDPPA